VTDDRRRSGLEDRLPWRLADDSLVLSEWRFPALLDIRRRGPGSDGIAAFLPPLPNTVAAAGDARILWLGPDQWLLSAPDGTAAPWRAQLAAAGATVTDVSAGRVVIEIAGTRARALLEKGCGLDLHPRAFGPGASGVGACAQTLLARAQIVLDAIAADPPRYRLIVRRSFARYLAAWLIDAAGEWSDL
jgi:sarcosine oxidase subunit gamma